MNLADIAAGLVLLSCLLFAFRYIYEQIGAWERRKACTEPVTAVLVQKKIWISHRITHVKLVFSYSYNDPDKLYRSEPLDQYGIKSYRRYEEGDEVTVYVNPDYPGDIRFKKVGGRFAFLPVPFLYLFFLSSCVSWIAHLGMALQSHGGFVAFLPTVFWFFVSLGGLIWVNARDA